MYTGDMQEDAQERAPHRIALRDHIRALLPYVRGLPVHAFPRQLAELIIDYYRAHGAPDATEDIIAIRDTLVSTMLYAIRATFRNRQFAPNLQSGFGVRRGDLDAIYALNDHINDVLHAYGDDYLERYSVDHLIANSVERASWPGAEDQYPYGVDNFVLRVLQLNMARAAGTNAYIELLDGERRLLSPGAVDIMRRVIHTQDMFHALIQRFEDVRVAEEAWERLKERWAAAPVDVAPAAAKIIGASVCTQCKAATPWKCERCQRVMCAACANAHHGQR